MSDKDRSIPFLRKTPPQGWNSNEWLPPGAGSNDDDLIEKEINPVGVECLENPAEPHPDSSHTTEL